MEADSTFELLSGGSGLETPMVRWPPSNRLVIVCVWTENFKMAIQTKLVGIRQHFLQPPRCLLLDKQGACRSLRDLPQREPIMVMPPDCCTTCM